MYRIDGPGSVPDKPARTALSPTGHGWFNQLGPSDGVATRITAEFLSAVQAEICNVVLAAGLPLDKANDGQLLAGIMSLIAAAIPAAEATKFPVEEKSANFDVVAADLRKMFIVDAPPAGVGVSPAAVAELGDGFLFGVVNRGTGIVTIDPDSTQKIGGRPGPAVDTFQLYPGESAMFAADVETGQLDVVAYAPLPPPPPAPESPRFPIDERNANFSVLAGDLRKVFVVEAPAGGVGVFPAPCAVLGDGFLFGVVNRGTGVVTVDPNGSEKIGGRPGAPTNTFQLVPGESALFCVDAETSQVDVILYAQLPPLTSFNGRTGAIVLNADDVTNALGYTPVRSFNGRTGIVTLTGTDVTTALGYAPLPSFNGRNGAITLTSTDVTNALGYTPVRSFNGRTGIVALTGADVTGALGYIPWGPVNDGAGSGLDADLLDGQHGAYYADIPARQGYASAPRPIAGVGTALGNAYAIAPTGTTTALPGTGAQSWLFIYGLGGNAVQAGVAPGGTVINTPDTGQRIFVWRVA